MEIQAAVLGFELERPPMLESTALGAAALAGLGTGLWPDLASLRGCGSPGRRFVPCASTLDAAQLHRRWRAAVGRAGGWAREL